MNRDASPARDSSDEYYTPRRGLLGLFGTRKLLRCTFCKEKAYVNSRWDFLNVYRCPGKDCSTCICEECDDEFNYCQVCKDDFCQDCIETVHKHE